MTGSVTFSTAIGGDGSTVTDDDNATTGLRDGGWRTRFVPCFTNQVSIANYVVTKAGEAATSQAAAASSAIAAAASYDSFDDRYLGAKTSDPTLDNDGNALLTGALYWNTTNSEMRVYSGSAWVAAYIPSSGYLALSGGTMTGNIVFKSGQPLGTPSSGTLTNCTFPTLNQNTTGNAATATTATNIASGNAGTIPYQSASGTTAMLAAGTTGQVLTSAGAAAPTWSTPAAATKTISNKTGAYTVVSGDLGKIINCTSGTFTVSLTAAASLGAGFTCTIWNTSNTATDVITIVPNGSETIDGVATLVLRRGEGLAIVCDGTNWQTDNKKPMRGYSENIVTTTQRPIASGNDSIAIARFASSSAFRGLAVGFAAVSSGDYGCAFGHSATSSSTAATAIGMNSGLTASQAVTGAGAMALGGSYASGTDSFAAAIGSNTSSYGATGANSIALGQTSKASGQYGVSLGYFNISSGSASFTVGLGNTASGAYSAAFGRYSTAAQSGKYAFGSAQNDLWAQGGKIVLSAATTTTTAVALTSDGSTASTTNQLIVASGQAMAIQGTLIAKQSGSGNMAAYNLTGAVSNNGGTMAVTGLALTLIGSDSIGLGASPTIAVDNTNKGVTITSGYKSATNIRWVATLNTSEVTY